MTIFFTSDLWGRWPQIGSKNIQIYLIYKYSNLILAESVEIHTQRIFTVDDHGKCVGKIKDGPTDHYLKTTSSTSILTSFLLECVELHELGIFEISGHWNQIEKYPKWTLLSLLGDNLIYKYLNIMLDEMLRNSYRFSRFPNSEMMSKSKSSDHYEGWPHLKLYTLMNIQMPQNS